MRDDEKLTYIDDVTGGEAEYSSSSPYFWANADGISRIANDIHTIQGIGQHGVQATGMQLAAREISVKVQIMADDVEAAQHELTTVLNPTHTGRLVYQSATVTRYIRCRIQKTPDFDDQVFPEAEIDFFCESPFWKEGDGSSSAVANIARWIGNLEWPLEITEEGYELEYRSPSLVTNIVNTGDVDAALTIEFYADLDVSNPKITNIQTQEYFSMGIDMLAGDCIRITTGYGVKAAVLIRGGVETSVFDYINDGSSWLQLAVGNNYLRAEASVDDNLSVKILYDFMYNGV